MSAPEPQPRMPRPKLWLYVVLLLLALTIGASLWIRGSISADRLTGIAISAMLTLFILSAVELIPESARHLGERSEAMRFRRFFGDAACKTDVRLVFPHRRLDPSLASDPWITHHEVPHLSAAKPVPEGVNAWLAAQDVRAAAYVSSMLFKYTDRDVKFIHDKDIEHDDFDHCTVSLGLGFNGFTRRLAAWCDDCLFDIQWGVSVKTGFKMPTDFFAIGESKIVPVPPVGKDDCIVARVVPRVEVGKPMRVCFVCAGRTAAGTAAAGFYLAKHWSKLLALYTEHNKDLQSDSLVAVVRHTADASGAQEWDSTGSIALDGGGTPLIAWGHVAGVR